MKEQQKKQNQSSKSNERNKEHCKTCGTIYHLAMIKSSEDYNDFGFRYCPYCGQMTEHIPNLEEKKAIGKEDLFVLVTLSGGLIDQVDFYSEPRVALKALSDFVSTMDIDDQDAAIYTPEGYYANAKIFLDENDEFIEFPEIP